MTVISVFLVMNRYLNKNYMLLNFISYSIILLLLYIFYHKDFNFQIKDFKKNYKTYFKKYFKIFIIGIAGMLILNIIASYFNSGLSSNETLNRAVLNDEIFFYCLLSLCVGAPLCEEIITRFIFRKCINNKYIFAIFSGVLFASGHLMVASSIKELLFILPYGFIGVTLAYIYADSNNILSSAMFHSLNNFVTLIIIYFI